MRIKMITMECGPDGNFPPGEIRTVSDERGKQLIAAKAAVQLPDEKPKAEKAQAPAGETAQAAKAETGKAGAGETRGNKSGK